MLMHAKIYVSLTTAIYEHASKNLLVLTLYFPFCHL